MTTTLTRVEGLTLAHDFAAAVQDACNRYFADHYPMLPTPQISVEAGRKYARIVQAGSQRSVHAFVDITNGTVLKAAGWSAPQKDKGGMAVRFDLTNDEDRERCFAAIDPFGGYLYVR